MQLIEPFLFGNMGKNLIRKFLTPTLCVKRVTDVLPNTLKKIGTNLILLDIDSTISVGNHPSVFCGVQEWIKLLKKSEMNVVLVSNNFKKRVNILAKMLNLPYLSCSMKPFSIRISKLIKRMRTDKKQVVMVGDQIFTDVLAANILGINSILVQPLQSRESMILRFKRIFERIIKRSFKDDFKNYPD